MTSTIEPVFCSLNYLNNAINIINSKFDRRHTEIIIKYNVGLKTFLEQGISYQVFYDDLVYKFKIIVGKLILVINSKR